MYDQQWVLWNKNQWFPSYGTSQVIIDSLLVATFRNMLTYTHTIQSSICMISCGSCGTGTSGSRVQAPVKVVIDSLLVATLSRMIKVTGH